VPLEEVSTEDPYYGRTKRFRAMTLAAVLETGFGRPRAELAREAFILRARDGYSVPIAGSRLFEGGAYLAIDDLDVPGFAPIGPQQVSPAPVYMFWTGSGRADAEVYPRPWQLDAIEIADFDSAFPHVLPRGEPRDGMAYRGLALFRTSCIRCHAINREGGRVGPDLNVPMNILEYRPEEQVRAYVRDPGAFRYGSMPAHPELTDADLDALITYLRAMGARKHDPSGAR
jgi:mono/diheme cytochrome c family protein